jgi:parvulin-like peptidyl-prolyl isomerase
MPTTANGETLDQELINQEFSQIKSWHEQQSQVSCCERDDEFLAQAKENVIGRVLLSQNAQTAVPDLSDLEIDQAIEQLKKDYGGEAQFFAQAGVGPNEMGMVRQQVNQNGKVDKLVQQISQSVDAVSEEALRAFYESHIDLYTSEPRVKAMHIYKSLRQTEDKEALFQACCKKRESLVSGSDFTEIAKEFSDKPEDEIDLGWFKRGELMDEFEFVAFSMKVDEISPVFSSYHGFHIAKVTDRDPAKAQPFEEVSKKVQEDHQLEGQNAELKSYIEKLRKSALIEETPDKDEDESSTQTP